MCGIAGYVGRQLDPCQIQSCLEQAVSLLHHRGPDDSGYYVTTDAGLGVCRLAIRDPSHGQQPMQAEDGTVIVFNGELYALEELRRQIDASGYIFQGKSDTEVLLQAYRLFGDRVVRRLSGMFAFGIWDPNRRRLLLARDQWGQKPLYVASCGDGLAFASEAKALRPWPGVNWEIQHNAIFAFLRHGYLPGEQTGWQGISKLLPGTMLVWENGDLRVTGYAQKPFPAVAHGPEPSLKEAASELLHLIDKAVCERLVSDRPIGALLSGGIDSSTIVGLMSRYITPVRTFSISWIDQDYTEESYSREVSHFFGTLHEEILCTSDYVRTHFDSIVACFDELFGDESMFPTALVAEVAKQHIDVGLAGDGADELFAGYERYQNGQCFSDYLEWCVSTQSPVMNSLCTPGVFEISEADRIHMHYYQEVKHRDVIGARRWVDLHTYLPSQILTKVDRMTMRVALETRAPFLDPTLSDWALRCDPRLICSGGISKRVLKAAVTHLLPRRIIERPKMGFGVPFVHWFRGSLSDWMEERLFGGALHQLAWLRADSVQQLVKEHRSGHYNHYRTLFNLLVLESWLAQ